MKRVTAAAVVGLLWLMIGGTPLEVLRRGIASGAALAGAASDPTDLGAALGKSDTAINVRTKIGRMAPRFTLPDADGRAHTITPEGRPHAIIFHMGWV